MKTIYGTAPFVLPMIKVHDKSGKGYRYVTKKIIEIDKFNPQAASSLVRNFSKYKKLDQNRKNLMKKELKKIINAKKLSAEVYELVSKIIK